MRKEEFVAVVVGGHVGNHHVSDPMWIAIAVDDRFSMAFDVLCPAPPL